MINRTGNGIGCHACCSAAVIFATRSSSACTWSSVPATTLAENDSTNKNAQKAAPTSGCGPRPGKSARKAAAA